MYCVVMAGGSGTRFWPASRKARPKQLLSLTGDSSLLQKTIRRMVPLTGPEQVLVVTGQGHARQVAEQLPLVPPAQILAEPMGRNTAPCVGLAAAWAVKQDKDAVCLVLPADHLITDEPLFIKTLERAVEAATEEEVLVTLGLTPRYPATGFGYIETGRVLDQKDPQLRMVKAFHEKPELAVAEKYLESGRHLWNSGMFVWRAQVLLNEIDAHLPELGRGLRELTPHLGEPSQNEALARIYPELPAISVDHGIMEKSAHLRVVKADFGWSDVGSWEAMGDLWPADEDGNACRKGRVLAIDSKDNLVDAGDRLTALVGVEGLVAVVTDDVLLVLPRERCQDVKKIIERLKLENLDEYL